MGEKTRDMNAYQRRYYAEHREHINAMRAKKNREQELQSIRETIPKEARAIERDAYLREYQAKYRADPEHKARMAQYQAQYKLRRRRRKPEARFDMPRLMRNYDFNF